MKNIIEGNVGEAVAYDYLSKKNYKIIAKNYRNYYGEIDVIALDKKTLVFIEVKARNSAKFGLPREAVNYRKQQKIRGVAGIYLQTAKEPYSNVRFDVLDILAGEITHIEDAF